jgi:hypothetical protein
MLNKYCAYLSLAATLLAVIPLFMGGQEASPTAARFGIFAMHTKLLTQKPILLKRAKIFHSTDIHQQDPPNLAKFVRMTQAINLQPFDNELPSHYADRLAVLYAKTVTTQHKKDNGQFFTPTEIARFMAGLVRQTKDKLKILDPGCGTAILSSSFIDTVILSGNTVKEIELVVYKTDRGIIE